MGKTDKRIRFEKVASNRVQRILDTLDLLQNCSNKNNYEYDEQDVDMMFSEISKHLKEAKNAFNEELSSKEEKKKFNFN